MIASIHQPAYIPWLGYFHKIAQSDVHIFLDDVEYSKNNLFNRNKIKTPQGPAWLTIPVKYKSTNMICETMFDESSDWQNKHWKTIKLNYSKSKFFKEYEHFFEKIYSSSWKYLSDFNIEMNKMMSGIFGIKTKFVKSSDLNVYGESNERLVNLCHIVKADVYLSGKGAIDSESNPHGKPYLDVEFFKRNNIEIKVQDFPHPIYNQIWGEFIPNLSAIDFLFNEGGEKFNQIVI